MKNKTIISPGQALLLLIDHYRSDPDYDIEHLKRLYLCGAENTQARNEITSLCKDDILSNYEISTADTVISEDPTRRYFETHLAYEILNNDLDDLDLDDLHSYAEAVKKLLKKHARNADYTMLPLLEDVYEARENDFSVIERKADNLRTYYSTLPDNSKEYFYYIKQLSRNTILRDLSQVQREKVILLAQIAYISCLIASFNRVPFNIYGKAPFDKSSILPKEKTDLRSQNLGLLKREMHLPYFDPAHTDTPHPMPRAADGSTFRPGSRWSEYNFKHWVHPFSASISGTMLGLIRTLLAFKNGSEVFTKLAENSSYYANTRNIYLFSKYHKTLCYITEENEKIMLINNDENRFQEFMANLERRYSLGYTISLSGKEIKEIILPYTPNHNHPELAQSYQSPFYESVEKLETFLTVSASAVLYFSGGHSFFEFLSPIFLDATRKEFQDVVGFDHLGMQVLQTQHPEAFEAALNDAIQYNRVNIFKKDFSKVMKLQEDVKQQKLGIILQIETTIENFNAQGFWNQFLFKNAKKWISALQKTIGFLQQDQFEQGLESIVALRKGLENSGNSKTTDIYQKTLHFEQTIIQLWDTNQSLQQVMKK